MAGVTPLPASSRAESVNEGRQEGHRTSERGRSTNELTAINQYFVHAEDVRSLGLRGGSATHERKASIDEMKHADALIERILFLEGLPNLQDLHKLLVGEDVKEALTCDLKLELAAHPVLEGSDRRVRGVGDYVSRDLFRRRSSTPRRSTSTGSKRSSS